MTSRCANAKKLARLAAMATLVTAAGWGLSAGPAQADVGLDNRHCVQNFDRDRHDFGCDRDFDFFRRHDFDRDRDFDFFHHDRNFFRPFFFGPR
jgi:hypothetical protein